MIEGLDEMRTKLAEDLKKQPKKVQELIEVSMLLGRAEFLSDLCKWGKSEAMLGRDISHYSLLDFASIQEKKLKDLNEKVKK